jgi:hypothetical protein
MDDQVGRRGARWGARAGQAVARPPTRPRRTRWAAVALAAAIGAAVSTSCSPGQRAPSVASLHGHSTTNGVPSMPSVAQSDQDFVNFARCVRQHGVPEPDPSHRPGHQGLSIDIPSRTQQNAAALDACNHLIAPVVAAKQAGAASQAAHDIPALTRYAQCMRAHDIAMLDPDSYGQLNLGRVPGISNDFGRYAPQFRNADHACRHLLPAGVHDDGTGP